jgi:hypothetical protein
MTLFTTSFWGKQLSRLTHLAIAGLLGASLLGFAGRWWWVADLFAHYRLYYVILLAVAIGVPPEN